MTINTIHIEVAFATKNKQIIKSLEIPQDTSVTNAIVLSKIADEFADEFKDFDFSDTANLHIGIFGRKIDVLTYKLKLQDRIEIYRKLSKTPNQRRLERKNTK